MEMDNAIQLHICALKSMGGDPAGAFFTLIIELKLDTGTMFEWQGTVKPRKPHLNMMICWTSLIFMHSF